MVPPLITLEEHFFSQAASKSEAFQKNYALQLKHVPGLFEKLTDLSHLRLKSMDESNISLQVISHSPGSLTLDECKQANDELSAAMKQHPTRFAGFATLPIFEPEKSAAELERCVIELEFKGALIDNHTDDGKYFDGTEYNTFWEKAEELQVPIYIHPTWATDEMRDMLYTGNFTPGAAGSLAASSWGWHSDVALHVLRLFAAGLFDRYPRLKIIIGHFGEMLPFMLERLVQLSSRWGGRQRLFKQVWDENIWITTSGVWSLSPLATILKNTRIERILYSVDYPFAKNEHGLQWVKELQESGMVTAEDLDRICLRNSEELLGVKAVKEFH
jgi:predicted TIM-barrel fold metal-dependent hydrolase